MGLPAGIGPHEGREIALMRAGAKQLALFVEVWPDDLDDFLAESGFRSLDFRSPAKHGIRVPVRLVHAPGRESAALTLRALYEAATVTPLDAGRERRIGRLLGYDEADIDTYLAHVGRSR